MLSLDLLRYRVEGENVRPVYLTARGGRKYVGLAERLIALFRLHVGHTLGELEESLQDELGESPEYKVHRGLVKILHEYAQVEQPASGDCEDLRRRVFTLAAQGGPIPMKTDLLFTRPAADRIAEIAAEVNVLPDTLPALLYADLRENHIIRGFDASVTPTELIERYNTALAQAMLFRATRMAVDIWDSYRIVFTHIKLAGLMHSIKQYEGGYRVLIDGAASLFENTERYGIGMARLLPAVLKARKWRLVAKVNVGGTEKLFRLSPEAGLQSHYRDEAEFDSSPEEAFYTKFLRNSKSKWTIEREGSVLDLKDTVLIPDFAFRHKDGRVAHLEIVGYWTPEYLAKKLDKLSRVHECNVVLAVPEVRDIDLPEGFAGHIVRYKHRLLIKDVLPVIEAVAANG